MPAFKIQGSQCAQHYAHALLLSGNLSRVIFYAHHQSELVDFFRKAGKNVNSAYPIYGYCGRYTKTRGARSEVHDGLNLRHNGWMAGMLKIAGAPQDFNPARLVGGVPDALQEVLGKITKHLPNPLTTGRYFVGFQAIQVHYGNHGKPSGRPAKPPHMMHGDEKSSVRFFVQSEPGGAAGQRVAFGDIANALEKLGWQGGVDLP